MNYICYWELRKNKIDPRTFFIIDIQITAE